MYQLADLITKHLVQATEDYATRLVVISDPLATFNEPELEEREARRLLSTIEQAIGMAKKNALVLTTLVTPCKYDEMVMSWADTAVNLTSVGGRVHAELLKHPNRPRAVTNFKLSQLLSPTKATQ